MDTKYFVLRFFAQLLLIFVAIGAVFALFGVFYVLACFVGKFASIGSALLVFFGIWLLWKKPHEPLPKFAQVIFCIYAVCALITALLPDPQASLLAAHYCCAAGFLASVAVWREPTHWWGTSKNAWIITNLQLNEVRLLRKRGPLICHRPAETIIWIRLGNCTTNDVADLLRSRHADILAFDQDPSASFLTLG
jgi:hypothetical protein